MIFIPCLQKKTPVTGGLPVEIIGRIPAWSALYFEARAIWGWKAGIMTAFFAWALTRATTGAAYVCALLHFRCGLENMAILPRASCCPLLATGRWRRKPLATNEQQRNAMKRLNMEMTGEYIRVADQGPHAAYQSAVCSYGLDEGRGVRVWLRHTRYRSLCQG